MSILTTFEQHGLAPDLQAYLHLALMGAALALLAAYICRIDKLNWRTHRPASVLLYVANAAAVAMVAAHGWKQNADALDVAVLLCAATLLRASWPRWTGGRPPVDMVRPTFADSPTSPPQAPSARTNGQTGSAFDHPQTLL